MVAELADGHNLSKKQAEALLDNLMTLAASHLRHGHGVRLTGLGTLHVQDRHPSGAGISDRRSHRDQGQGKDRVLASQGVEGGHLTGANNHGGD